MTGNNYSVLFSSRRREADDPYRPYGTRSGPGADELHAIEAGSFESSVMVILLYLTHSSSAHNCNEVPQLEVSNFRGMCVPRNGDYCTLLLAGQH